MTRVVELVLKKLADIETFVAELRRLGRPAEIGKDLVHLRSWPDLVFGPAQRMKPPPR